MKITEGIELSYVRKMGDLENHKTENELIVILPVGCYWAKRSEGGCAYCGYQKFLDDALEKFEPVKYIDILKNELDKQEEPVHRLSFFVGGSFFEINRAERLELLNYLNDYNDIKEVYIESRPELITEDNIKELKDIIKDKQLSVAIGLETSNEKIRNEVHKKGVDEKTFLKALNILKNVGVKSLIYVFVKPPLENITDKQAFEEAYETIKYCFDNGADMIELECGYIVENSKMHQLYLDGKYSPLKLWTIQELLLESIELGKGPVRLAYFSDTPKPIDGPKNCDKCSDQFFEMFDEYRKTMDTSILKKQINCDCKIPVENRN